MLFCLLATGNPSFPSSASLVEGKRGKRYYIRKTTLVTKSVVLVVSPLNALMYDQISKLRRRGVEAAVLGVKNGNDAESPIISQWEGVRESIIQAGYEIVFCHPEAFLSSNDGLEVLQSSVYLSAVKAVVVDEAPCILES